MVSINYATREVTCKIVYYGPGLSGKTTNLQYIHDKVPGDTRGKMISLATEADRTLYFDFLPINIGKISGLTAKFQLYTVPGQVYYNATRKLVLRGADGLVFVADSQADKMDENIESINNMKENLAEYGYDINEMPIVIQYNKRDLPNVLSVEELEAQLNPYGWKCFEGEAVNGRGVFDTLKMSIKLVLDKARRGQTGGSKKETTAEPKQAETHAAARMAANGTPVAGPTVETATEAAISVDEADAVREPAYDIDRAKPNTTEATENGDVNDVGKTAFEHSEINGDAMNGDQPDGKGDTAQIEQIQDSNESSAPPMEENIVTAGSDNYLQPPEPEPEPEDNNSWGQDRPFPGSTSRISRRGRRITVSDFQGSAKAGDADEAADESEIAAEGDSYGDWHTPTMAPSTRIKKKKRGFFKRLFGIK